MKLVGKKFIIQQGELGVRVFESSCINNVSEWLSHDYNELSFVSSTLPYPCSTSEFNKHYVSCLKKGSHKFFRVYSTVTQKHIGHFEIKNISSSFLNGTISHVVLGDKNYRNKGLGKDLIKLMVKIGFEYLDLYRLGLAVHMCNYNAITAYIKGGFVFEGIIRDVLKDNQKRVSLYQMAVLKSEWKNKCV